MFSTEIYTIPFMFPLYHTESTMRLLLFMYSPYVYRNHTVLFIEQTYGDISAGVIREVVGEFVVDSVGVTVGSEGQYDPDSLFPN